MKLKELNEYLKDNGVNIKDFDIHICCREVSNTRTKDNKIKETVEAIDLKLERINKYEVYS